MRWSKIPVLKPLRSSRDLRYTHDLPLPAPSAVRSHMAVSLQLMCRQISCRLSSPRLTFHIVVSRPGYSLTQSPTTRAWSEASGRSLQTKEQAPCWLDSAPRQLGISYKAPSSSEVMSSSSSSSSITLATRPHRKTEPLFTWRRRPLPSFSLISRSARWKQREFASCRNQPLHLAC